MTGKVERGLDRPFRKRRLENQNVALARYSLQQARALPIQCSPRQGWHFHRDLAEDIGRRRPLQSLNIRSVLNADGQETGMFEVPAGGRRYLMRKPAEGLATANPVAVSRARLMLYNDN